MKNKLLILALLYGLHVTFFPVSAEAAKFFFVPGKATVAVGTTFIVDLKIDSEGVQINGTEGLVRFPTDLLDLVAVKHNGSAFNLWVKEPQFLKEKDGIYFVASNQLGLLNSSLQVLQLEFKVKNAGNVTLQTLESLILAHDGLGTDVGGINTSTAYQSVIDNIPPLPFKVTIDTEKSDNPLREISYKTTDKISSIKEYVIFIDGREVIRTNAFHTTLPPQSLGKHNVLVRAVDFVGNNTESTTSFLVLPLATPTINVHTKVLPYGQFGFVTGKVVQGANVDVRVIDWQGRVLFRETVNPDESGNWELAVHEILPGGEYSIIAFARDPRGAVSRPANPDTFRVQEKPIIVFGFINLGWSDILIIIIMLVIFLAGSVGWYYFSRKKLRDAYKKIITRDIDNVLTTLHSNVDDLKKLNKSENLTNGDYYIGKIMDNISNMKKYIVQGVEKIR